MKNWIQLLEGYLTDQLTAAELREFLQQSSGYEPEMMAVIDNLLKDGDVKGLGTELQRLKILQRIQERKNQPVRKVVYLKPLYRTIAAAAVLLIVVCTTWLLVVKKAPPAAPPVAARILPGTNKAVLTLSDGSVIELDSTGGNTITDKSGIKIINLAGQLSYSKLPPGAAANSFNTLATPRGGQYHILLPDGSKVWLNAASSIRFPVAFTGKERRVEVTGEAYFEVAQKKGQPFMVQAPGQLISVLGTHFNVTAYNDEKEITTTLVQGKVKIKTGTGEVIMSPGQQAKVLQQAGDIHIASVDTTEVMAWMQQKFVYNNADLATVMRKIQRWYVVDVRYEKGIDPESHFSGSISMDQELSDVLKVLELSGIHFKVENKTVIVLP